MLRLILYALAFALASVLVPGLLYLAFWPVDIEPVAWSPPAAPALAGPYAPNGRLKEVVRLAEGLGRGPESIAFDRMGRLVTGYEDGRIVRFARDGKNPTVIANTGGRPLGLDYDLTGNLYVADAAKGLLRITPDGAVAALATEAEGGAFRFTNDLAVARTGVVYFTDSSMRFGAGEAVTDIFEHRPTGRLMAFDPRSGSLRVLMRGLQYANGVALSADQQSVAVVETGWYRVHRYWLAGPKAGTSEILIANLPGFPDNITARPDGGFWLALFTVRNPAADRLAGWPFLRKVVWRLPQSVQPEPKRYSFVLGLDADGNVTHNLQDPTGRFAPITSAREAGGWLYLGSLEEKAIGRIKVP